MSSKAVVPHDSRAAMSAAIEKDPATRRRKKTAQKRIRHFRNTIANKIGLAERIFTNIGDRIKEDFFPESSGIAPIRIKVGSEISESPTSVKAAAMPIEPQLLKTMITEEEYAGNLKDGAMERMTNFDRCTFFITNQGLYVLALYKGNFYSRPELALGILTDSLSVENFSTTGGNTFEYTLNDESKARRNGKIVGELNFLFINPEKSSVLDALQRNGEENTLRVIDSMRSE